MILCCRRTVASMRQLSPASCPTSEHPADGPLAPALPRRYWLAVGAQPSDRVQWLLGRAGVLPMPPKAPKLIRPPKEDKKK
jgi:hypothetical protein